MEANKFSLFIAFLFGCLLKARLLNSPKYNFRLWGFTPACEHTIDARNPNPNGLGSKIQCDILGSGLVLTWSKYFVFCMSVLMWKKQAKQNNNNTQAMPISHQFVQSYSIFYAPETLSSSWDKFIFRVLQLWAHNKKRLFL